MLGAAGALDLARADRMPDLGIGGGIRWSTSVTRYNRSGTTNSISSIGPLLDLPLFDWGLRRARVQARFEPHLRSDGGAAVAYPGGVALLPMVGGAGCTRACIDERAVEQEGGLLRAHVGVGARVFM